MIKVSEKKKETSFNSDKPNYYIDISSSQKIEFDYILIKNHYVASVSIQAFIDNKWEIVLDNYVLMNNCDVEEDSEKYFLIQKKNLKIEENDNYTQMRFYLYQDSIYWKEYTLATIKFINENDPLLQSEKVKFDLTPKQKFTFKDRNVTLCIDKDEINQIYNEIANGNQNDYSNINFFC